MKCVGLAGELADPRADEVVAEQRRDRDDQAERRSRSAPPRCPDPTAVTPVAPWLPMVWKASRMPQTVPSSPRKGAALIVVARMISRCSRSRKYLSSTAVTARVSVANCSGAIRVRAAAPRRRRRGRGRPAAPRTRARTPRRAATPAAPSRRRPGGRARGGRAGSCGRARGTARAAGVAEQQPDLADHDRPGDDREHEQQQVDRLGREARGGEVAQPEARVHRRSRPPSCSR